MATLKNTPNLPDQRERIVSAAPVEDDSSFELKLRPQRLAEFIGQAKVKENLAVAIEATRSRGEALDHVLLYGPLVLGKMTLGTIIVNELGVPFLDAVNGATTTITLPEGGTLQVTIPPGVEDGQVLRLRGKGAPSPGAGPPGDALVQINVQPHRYFTREGDDIHVELPISIKEAALGGEVRAPTTTGSVMLKVPRHSNSGDTLRLKGKGVKRRCKAGDELVKLRVTMPRTSDAELDRFLSNWNPPDDPRTEM